MSWKCPRCGFDPNADDIRSCGGGCGYNHIPSRLLLVATGTGRQIAIAVDTTVGKFLLKSFAGDDANYASDPQFRIYKDTELGSWALRHCDTAKNPTFCNGADVSAGTVALGDGAIISIGAERMRLTVRLDD